jgi:Ca2+-binding RTX toxin-like protein
MAASTYFAQVQQLYIAYFGRPADTIGLNFWATQIDAANGSIAAVQAGFSASTESQALFGNKSTIDKVTAIYQNAFGRAPEPAGLAFWVAQLDSGKVTQAQASWTIQQSAGAGDAAVVQAKLVAAQAFTAQIDTTAEIVGYQGTGAADAGRAFLATVVSAATGATAVTNAPSALATAVNAGGTGSSFALTAGVDNLTGTASNDIFTADNTQTAKTLGAADTINGGAGVDTLRVFLAAGDASFANPTLSNVENVTINGGIVTAYTAAAGTTGLTIEAPVALGATYTVAGQAVTLKGATVAGTTTITSTADTAANVTLNGWGSATLAETVALTGAAVATATLTATGANSSITLNGTSALKTLNLTGDKNLTVATNATVSAGLTSINASTATGVVNVDVSAATVAAAFAFTGSAGNDTLTLADGNLATLTAGTQLNGGAGVDTLVIKNAALTAAEYTKLNAVTGFEVLGFGSNAAASSVDASQLTAIKSFAISASAVNESITNLGAGTAVAVTGTNSGVVSLGAALGNSTTEVSVGAAGAAGVTVANLTTTGLITLGLTSNGTSLNTITALNNSDNSTITVKGATDLTIGSIAGGTTGSKVDASAFTGKLTVTGSAVSDIIIGGTGADTINGGAGADTLTGGAGVDTFAFTTATGANTSGTVAGSFDKITDFVVGTDKLQFVGGVGVVDVVSGQQTAVQAAVTALAATATAADIYTAMATANTTSLGVSFATFGGNTYALYETAGATNGVPADDAFIQLTGVTTGVTFANSVVA